MAPLLAHRKSRQLPSREQQHKTVERSVTIPNFKHDKEACRLRTFRRNGSFLILDGFDVLVAGNDRI